MHVNLALARLRDHDAQVQRAGADALGGQPHPEHIRPLLSARHGALPEDAALVHTIRMALRNQLQAPGGFEHLRPLTLDDTDARVIADVSLGIRSADAGRYILEHLVHSTEPRDKLVSYLRHAGRYAPEAALAALDAVISTKAPDDPDAQYVAYKSVQEGYAQRGIGLSASLRGWATRLAEQLLNANAESGFHGQAWRSRTRMAQGIRGPSNRTSRPTVRLRYSYRACR